MSHPVMSTADASAYLNSKRAGSLIDLDRLVKLRGNGPEIGQAFVAELLTDLASLKAKYGSGGMRSQKSANEFEAEAGQAIHERVKLPSEALADPDFWLWLSVAHFGDIVEWRYGQPENGTGLANYGIGARSENLLYRLWLRADLVLDEQAATGIISASVVRSTSTAATCSDKVMATPGTSRALFCGTSIRTTSRQRRA